MTTNKVNLPKTKTGHTYIQWYTSVLASTTIMTYGLTTGWVSPMTKILKSDSSPAGVPLTDVEISWVASIVCIMACFSVFPFTYLIDKYGRRVGVIAIAVCQALCWILKLFSNNLATLIVARALSGLASGGCYNVIPIYIKEISQDDIRGKLGILLSLLQNVGMLTIYAVGAYFDYYTVLWIVMWIPIVTMVLFVKAPESPAYLVKIGKIDEAAAIIAYFRGLDVDDASVQKAISSLKSEDAYFKSLPDVSIFAIFKEKAWRRGFILSILIITAHSSSGTFTIITHASAILASSGVTISPELQPLSFPVVMIVGSFLAMGCVERFGRKPLLATGLSVVSLSMLTIGTIILIQHQGGSVPWWLTVLAMISAMTAYSAGVLSVLFIFLAEIFNFQIRAKCMGFIVSYAWFLTSVQLFAFPPISNAFGLHTAFYCFAAINLFGALVTLVLMPETRGKSVEEIETILRKK